MALPLVSTITPVFNGAEYIRQTLASIAASTYENIEIIVADDGSSDGSAQVALEFLEECGRPFKVLRKENTGEADTDNFALAHTSGEFVLIVNADDPIMADLIAESVDLLTSHPSVVASYPDWQMVNGAGKVIRTVHTQHYSKEALVGDVVCIPGPGAMIRKSAIGPNRLRKPTYRFTSDFVQWLDLSLKGDMMRIPKVLATWRTHEKQQSQTMKGALLAEELVRAVQDFFERADLDELTQSLRRQAFSMAYYHAAIQSLYGRGVPGRLLALRSLFYVFRRHSPVGSRRDFRIFILIAANPLGRVYVSWWNRNETRKRLARGSAEL